MSYWVNESVFYHIYPIGFCGAPRVNDGETVCRLDKVIDWIPHLKSMSVNAIYFGPVFKSTVHGYDTDDYRVIDNRLGTNESFKHTFAMNFIRMVLKLFLMAYLTMLAEISGHLKMFVKREILHNIVVGSKILTLVVKALMVTHSHMKVGMDITTLLS